MIDAFQAAFGPTICPDAPQEPPPLWDGAAVAGYAEIMSAFAGATCQGGLYRLHTAESSALAEALVTRAFPRYRGRLVCVGVDWLGRQYALDRRHTHPEHPAEPLLLSFDPEADIPDPEPTSFGLFHTGAGLESCSPERWSAWAAANPDAVPLILTHCVGLRVPLFLGGADAPANMAVLDIAVYWRGIVAQIRQMAELPPLPD